MTGKLGFTGISLVWLLYVVWMVNYYSGTLALFSR